MKNKGIFIRNSGLLTTVQDLGRYKYQAFGVSVSGAMDQRSLKLANLLVGNDVDEAGLEVTMLGPTIEFMEDNIIAITGGDLMPQLNNVGISMNTALVCHKGDILSFKGIKSGSRAYIAFAGGLSVPTVMGSKSTYTKASIGGFKGRKLEKGDEIGFKNPKASIHNLSKRTLNINNQFSNDISLRIIMGPQEDYFTEEGLNTFLNSTYTVSNEFDRMGCRLEGEKIQHKKDGNIISDGIALGAIQVPSHGTPIIMLADRQTVGGYTKIANVISVDLPKLAQAKPGDKISFLNVSIEEAQNLYIKELKDLEKLKEELSIENKSNAAFYKIKLNNKIYDVSVEKL
ncbi:MAG TPA: KipI antagonist [Clostridiales bacterium]|nr:KipI antagonist [Clostridiales bacterium]